MICPHGVANRFKCKQCVAVYNRAYYKRTRDEQLVRARTRYHTDAALREAHRIANRKWEARNRQRSNEISRNYKKRLKLAAAAGDPHAIDVVEKTKARRNERSRLKRLAAIERLGGSCEKCGTQDQDVLQFDHRTPVMRSRAAREAGRSSSGPSYQEILTSDHPESVFSLFCANCHIKKTRENGEYRGGR